MAINTLADWRMAGAHARQSILGRPRRKDEGRAPDGEDDDEVQRSPATEHHIETFFDALQAGDAAEQSHALAKIVDTWRADNNAGGLPVYAHLPLPSAFANELAQVVQSNRDGKAATESLAAKLEPGARLSVFQQLRGAVSNQTRNTAHQNTAFADENDDDNLTSPFATAQAQPAQPTQPPLRPSYQPTGQPAPQATQQQESRQKDPAWWSQKPLLPPEEGGEAALEPKPRPNGPFASPPPPEEPDSKHSYGAWSQNRNARSEAGSLLVSPSRLSQLQQENLMQRSWIHPTGKLTGAGRLEEGWGYFGAPRTGANAPYHGGFDAPYKYPTDPEFDENGKPIVYNRTVRLPTRAVCTGFAPNSASGKPINRLSFDLGDGLTLELLHVQLTPALDAKIKAAQRSGRPLELDAGEILGDVDADHDHTHIQLIASGPNGERWVVDPTYFMEKRARTFWREPQNDLVDSVIDLGRGAVDWTRRQFE